MCVQTNNWFHVFRGLTDLTLQKRLQRTFLARQKIPVIGTLAIHGQLKPYPRRMLKITAKTWRYIVLLMAATFWSDAHHSTASERFSLFLIYLGANKFVLLRVLTLEERFCPRICSKSRLKSAKSPLQLTCVAQKRRCLNSLLCSMNYSNINSLWGPVSTRIRVFLKTESFFSVFKEIRVHKYHIWLIWIKRYNYDSIVWTEC